MKKIGGFFEVEKASVFSLARKESVHATWLDEKNYLTFSNARSAILAVRQKFKSCKIWIPEIFCGIFENEHEISTYLLNEKSFEPDLEFLEKALQANDTVVVPDYFGIEPSNEFMNFVKNNIDIHWIQDATHNLNPRRYWGDFTVFSPRKLFGVLDGGILIQNNIEKYFKFPTLKNKQISKIINFAPVFRRVDTLDLGMKTWFRMYQNGENRISSEPQDILNITKWQLKRIDMNRLIIARRRNFNVLDTALNSMKVQELVFDENATPFGYPIYIEDRDEVQRKLSLLGVYAAVHWRTSSSLKTKRQESHHNLQLTLPCDHRYNSHDMLRIIKIILKNVES